MNRGRSRLLFAARLAVPTLLASWLAAPGALAQGGPFRVPSADPGAFTTTVRPPARRPAAPAPVAQPQAAPVVAPPREAEPGAEPMPDPATDPDAPTLRRTLSGRPVPIDGDMSWPPEPAQPVDGVVDPAEPTQPVDGADPSLVDTRPVEDTQPFELPQPPAEPGLESIEIEPILDRRPAQLARFEPFDPVGIRRGGFILYPEAEISVAALDNLFRSSSGTRRDVALDVRPAVRAVSNWRTHALEFRATGLSTFHADFPSEDDRAWTLEARGRLDITRRTNVEIIAGWDRSQETRGSINAVSRTGDRADIDTTRAGLTLNHRFNRLSVQLRGTVTSTDYAPVTTDTGTFASNDDRDLLLREAAFRAAWTFKPELAVFSEVAVNTRTFAAAPGDGISRDSSGERVRLGVSFGTTSQRLRGEVSIGHGRQHFEDSRLPEIRGIIVDANLAWRLSGLTSLLATARTDVGESTLVGSGGALSHTAGLELRHAFQRRLIGTTGLRLTRQDYEGIDLVEREVAAIAGLEYYVNREVTLFGRYQHIDFESTERGRNYTTEEVRVGIRVRR